MPRQPKTAKATIKDVALACKLSVSTVSCALADKDNVKPETKAMVREVAARLGYSPSLMARGLRLGRTWTIGVVISDIGNPFYGDLLRGLQETAGELGYNVIICSTDYDAGKQKKYVEYLIERQADGIVIVTASSQTDDIQTITDARIPVVMLLRKHQSLATDFVGIDNTVAVNSMLEHLWQLGHRDIGFITGRENLTSSEERLAAYVAFLQARGIALREAWVAHASSTESASNLSRKMLTLPHRPTAIAATADILALGVMKSSAELGIAIPAHLSLVGSDDIFVSGLPQIALTTVRHPRWEMGMTAARLVVRRIEGARPPMPPEIILFRTELIARATTGTVA